MSTNNAGSQSAAKKKRKNQGMMVFPKIVVLGASELTASAMLLCFGCMGCIPLDAMELSHHVPSLSFGLVIMVIIMTFGHISGAHINPVVTLSSMILGLLSITSGAVYIVCQIVGSLLGFGLLKLLVPPEFTRNERFDPITNQTVHEIGLCTTFVHPKVSVVQALGLEMVLTITLILLCCSVWDKRNSLNTDSLPLRFGLTITAIAMIAGPLCGASMNPIRSFAPALYNNDWDKHWIYWVGPVLGSVVATVFYKTLFSVSEEHSEEKEDEIEDVPLNEKTNRV